MFLVNQPRIQQYLEDDRTSARLSMYSSAGDEQLVCQRWLRQSAPKRFIHDMLYGDLFEGGRSFKVLDVGGGLTGLSSHLATRHDYELIDLLAHDPKDAAETMMRAAGRRFVTAADWASVPPAGHDLVVANDLFPNVDQRLELFLEAYLPRAKSIRLSLTYYDSPRFYMTRRIDGEEVLCMLAWNGAHLQRVLSKYQTHIVSPDLGCFAAPPESVYENGRQVCLLELHGQG